VVTAGESLISPEAQIDPDGVVRWYTSRWPAWSPDGTTVAYQSDVDDSSPEGFDIWAYSFADGSRRKLIPDAVEPDWQPLVGPDCSAIGARPRVLWPPDHRLRRVRLTTADPDVTVQVTGVTSNEPQGRRPDWILIPGAPVVRLRAERSPHGQGRVYAVAFTAADASGSCDGSVAVRVPRHRRHHHHHHR